jgi:hypothetical protein
MMSERGSVEKIIEQELNSILLQSIKLAQTEEKPLVKDTLHIILRVIDARRSEREKASATEP